MSDWKSRSKVVTPSGSGGSWKDRSKVVATLQTDPIETEEPGLLIADFTDPTPSAPVAAMFGAANGASFGFADEIGGAIDVPLAVSKYLMQKMGAIPEDERISDEIRQPGVKINNRQVVPPSVVPDSGREEFSAVRTYQQGRDALRAIDKAAQEAHPVAHFGGEVAGIVAAPVGTLKAAAGVGRLARAGQGAVEAAKIGAMFGAGNSTADLTGGDVSNFVGDMEDAAMLSVPFGAVGGVYAGRQADRQAKAAADALAQQQKLADKTFASARGTLGGETSAGFRTLEHLESVLADEAADPALRQEAAAFLNSEAGKALKDSVLRNAVLRGKDQLGRIANAQQGFSEAAAATKPDAVQGAAADFLNQSTLKKDVFPRLAKYLERWIPQEMSNLAGGGDVGQVASTVVGAQIGAPGTSAANLVRNPRFRFKAAQAFESGTQALAKNVAGVIGTNASDKIGQYLGGEINPALFSSKYGPALEEAKAKGGTSLAVMHYLSMMKDPEYRALAEQKPED